MCFILNRLNTTPANSMNDCFTLALKQRTWLFFALVILLTGCQKSKQSTSARTAQPATRSEVVHFCGDCHAYPQPETFPIEKWREEVEQGYQFYADSNRSDLTIPNKEAVIAYYESQAPEFLKIPLPEIAETTSPVQFFEEQISRVDAPQPAISDISELKLQQGGANIAVCDMRMGQVSLLDMQGQRLSVETIADIPFPAHLERCDLDQNGVEDWIVSDLGSFEPEDHQLGQLIWIRLSNDGYFESLTTLLKDVGRVADARVADFDQDGDMDIVVAIFGWRKQGKLIWLEQVGSQQGIPDFEEHLLSERHGCSHAPLIDFDGDGDVDIVTLFSQEYELIEAYMNDGTGEFAAKTIYQATDPSYGSSSIELVDIDGDGDHDILYTNGDSLDSHLLKPYHSVQWIEQKENDHFHHHHLTDLPGAYGVQAGDLDGDGDTDLVACSMTLNFQHPFHNLIWLERTQGNTFQRHNLQAGIQQHACLQLGDFDGDGDLDIATGHFEPRPVEQATWLSIWWNEGSVDGSNE